MWHAGSLVRAAHMSHAAAGVRKRKWDDHCGNWEWRLHEEDEQKLDYAWKQVGGRDPCEEAFVMAASVVRVGPFPPLAWVLTLC